MKHQPEAAAVRAVTVSFAMEDNGPEQKIEPVESTERESMGDKQRLEETTVLGSTLSEVATAMQLAVQEPPEPAEGNPCLQRGSEVVEDGTTTTITTTTVTTTTSSSGSGSCSGFDADVDDTDYAFSVASSADLIEAYDNALEALQLGNQRERNTFLWIDKCLEKVGSASSDLRKFATDVLRTTGIGNIDVQWTISKGGTAPPIDDIYKRRFLAVHEYLLAAYQDLAVQENAKMAESEANTGETEISSGGMGAYRGSDTWGVVVNQGNPDTSGESKAKSSGDDGEVVQREEELEAKFCTLTTGAGEVKTVKMDERKTGTGDRVTSQQEVTPEDATNSRGGNGSESLATGGGAEKSGDKTATSDAVEGGHQELTASTSSASTSSSSMSISDLEELRPTVNGKHHATDEARKRAQVIQKLVARQREALSRIYATAQTRVYRMSSVCQFLLTCVNCAACICKTALNAHGLARLALQIVETAGTADVVSAVREAAIAASQDTDLAIVSCEKAAQLHMDAVRILQDCWLPLTAVRNDDLLGEQTIREITRVAEDLKLMLDRADFSPGELANKLSLMESMIEILSQAVKRAKNVNLITKHLVNKFDGAAFQAPVVGAVFGASQLTVRVMTSATDAMRPLYRLGTGAQTPERSGQDIASQNVPSVGHGNIPRGEESVNETNDL